MKLIRDYFALSLKSLKNRKIRSWLTMIGIFIGVAAVVALVSLGQGLREAVTGQFASFGTDKLIIQAAGTAFGPPGSTVVEKLTSDDADVIRKVRGIDIVAERLFRSAPVRFKDERKFAPIVSLTQDESRKLVLEVIKESLNIVPEEGRMLFKDDRYKIVVGNDFKSKKRLFSRRLRIGDTLEIEGKEFTIVGILKKSASIFGNDVIIMNDDIMRETLDIGKEVDIIAAQVTDFEQIESIGARVEKALRRHRDVEIGKEDFSVQTPAQAVETVNNILNYVTWFLVFIAMISLIVGGIGIMNTMFTAVLERRNEIGIMKAVGARNSNIMVLFLVESGVLGLIGGIVGIIFGIALSKGVEIIATITLGTQLIQAHYTLTWILVPLLFSFFVGSASGAVPAVQAAKLNPVDALRK